MAIPPTNCDNCGVCCALVPAFYPLKAADLASDLRKSIERVRDGLMGSALRASNTIGCIMLDRLAGRCKCWDRKPAECTGYGIGGELCLAALDTVAKLKRK